MRAMGVCRALESLVTRDYIGPIWRRQASHGEGKSGPVETGLTGPVATALIQKGNKVKAS